MTQEEFDKYNTIFNNIITKSDLDSDFVYMTYDDGVLSRVFKKINGEIPVHILSELLILNTLVARENFEEAEKCKNRIIEK